MAREGILFSRAYTPNAKCAPSRSCILTGRNSWQLEEAANHWPYFPAKFRTYAEALPEHGWHVGFTGKGWGPGNFQAGGFTRNPAGPSFTGFAEFLKAVPAGKPFCFWFGSTDPHRPYESGSGANLGLQADQVVVPPFWPDNEVTRNDILDYYGEVERFDREAGEAMKLLDKAGLLENTIVIMTGDNGVPFPRCKANLYDGGTRQPLAVRWPGKVRSGQVRHEFINLMDLAPTLARLGLAPRRSRGGGWSSGARPDRRIKLRRLRRQGGQNTVTGSPSRQTSRRAGSAGARFAVECRE